MNALPDGGQRSALEKVRKILDDHRVKLKTGPRAFEEFQRVTQDIGALGVPVERLPYSAAGAPAVPDNQIVRASIPTAHSLVYRAEAAECREGSWQVFCHHGAAYAIDAWPGKIAELKRTALRSIVEDVADTVFPSMPKGWPGFYWRCRFTQDPTAPGRPIERLRFDIAEVIE